MQLGILLIIGFMIAVWDYFSYEQMMEDANNAWLASGGTND